MICSLAQQKYAVGPVGVAEAVFEERTVEPVIFAWTNQSLEAEIKKDRNVAYGSAKGRLWWACIYLILSHLL